MGHAPLDHRLGARAMDFASVRADGMRDEPLVQQQPSASLHSLHSQVPVRQGHTQIHATKRDLAAALDAERAWARVALNTVGDAVLTIDLQGAITHMNRMAEILTGELSSVLVYGGQ